MRYRKLLGLITCLCICGSAIARDDWKYSVGINFRSFDDVDFEPANFRNPGFNTYVNGSISDTDGIAGNDEAAVIDGETQISPSFSIQNPFGQLIFDADASGFIDVPAEVLENAVGSLAAFPKSLFNTAPVALIDTISISPPTTNTTSVDTTPRTVSSDEENAVASDKSKFQLDSRGRLAPRTKPTPSSNSVLSPAKEMRSKNTWTGTEGTSAGTSINPLASASKMS